MKNLVVKLQHIGKLAPSREEGKEKKNKVKKKKRKREAKKEVPREEGEVKKN